MHLYKKLLKKLIIKNLTISTAESCTGGLLAYCFTKNKDSSKVYKGGYITYSNDLKIKNLNVRKKTMEIYGAVSKQTAEEMVSSLYQKNKTNISISTTGIAGPSGATNNKPVGLIYIGFCFNGNINIIKKNFKGSRLKIQKQCVDFIFKYLNNLI